MSLPSSSGLTHRNVPATGGSSSSGTRFQSCSARDSQTDGPRGSPCSSNASLSVSAASTSDPVDVPPASASTTSSEPARPGRDRRAALPAFASRPRRTGGRRGRCDRSSRHPERCRTRRPRGSRQRADRLGLGLPRAHRERRGRPPRPARPAGARRDQATVELGAVPVLACDDERACAESTHYPATRAATSASEPPACTPCLDDLSARRNRGSSARVTPADVATGATSARPPGALAATVSATSAERTVRGAPQPLGPRPRSCRRQPAVRWVDDQGDARPFEHVTRGGRQRGRETECTTGARRRDRA